MQLPASSFTSKTRWPNLCLKPPRLSPKKSIIVCQLPWSFWSRALSERWCAFHKQMLKSRKASSTTVNLSLQLPLSSGRNSVGTLTRERRLKTAADNMSRLYWKSTQMQSLTRQKLARNRLPIFPTMSKRAQAHTVWWHRAATVAKTTRAMSSRLIMANSDRKHTA